MSKSELVKNIKESAKIRYNLNENLHRQANKIRNKFKQIFNFEPRYFTKLKDLHYYRGGWPSENTPPRIETFSKNIIEMIHLYEFLGDDELKNILMEGGIEIKVHGNDEKFKNNSLNKEQMLSALNNLLLAAIEVQGEICREADKIKIENYEEFVILSDNFIKKGDYTLCVQNEYLNIKESDKSRFEENFDETISSLETAINIIKN